LLEYHESTTLNLCQKLNIKVKQKIRLPGRTSNVIAGKNLPISKAEKEKLKQICADRLKQIPELDAVFSDYY